MLTEQTSFRYAQQLLLPEWSATTQEQLFHKKIIIIGLGGLGNPVLSYLVSAGIGHITLIDGDKVSLSNLPRQFLFQASDVGQLKVNCCRTWINNHNRDILVETIPKFADLSMLQKLVGSYDLILDCTDNIHSRRNINKACVENNIPYVSAAAAGWFGQVFYHDNQRACFDCLFDGLNADSCDSLGVLGPILGAIGSMQALLALQILTNIEKPTQKLYRFDGRQHQWNTLTMHKQQTCPTCGDRNAYLPQ